MEVTRDSSGRHTRVYLKAAHLYFAGFFVFMVISALMLALPSPYHWLPFILVAGLLFVAAAVKFPFAGLFAYLLIFFLNPNELFPIMSRIPLPYEKIIAVLVITGLAINIAFVKKRFELFHLDYAFLALLAAAFVSILGASDLQTAWDQFFKFFRIFLVYVLLVRIADTPGKLKAVIVLYALSVAFLAISSAVLYYSGEFEFKQGIQRARSLGEDYVDPNTMSNSLIMGIPFLFYLAKAHKSFLLKLLMLSMLGCCLWTIILTGSRGGMVGALVLMLLIGWHSRHRIRAMAAVLAVVAVVAAAMPEQYQERFLTILTVGQEDEYGAGASAYGRINGLILGFQFLLHNPLTGIGIGNFGWHHRASGGDWTDAHNLVGKLVGELGLLGVIAFTFFLVRFVQNIKYVRWKYLESDSPPDFIFYTTEAVKLGLIMLLVQGLFSHNLYRFNWYVFAGFLAVIANLVKIRFEGRKPAGETAVETPTGEASLPAGQHD
ncbi:MAG: O-antigen ligase family protein [candidate division Zixibacteria bacterium]|nr:O-antigen ligase family protein [candidate division Zixibacteria bacterium]